MNTNTLEPLATQQLEAISDTDPTQALAKQFVDLVLKYDDWSEVKELPADDQLILVSMMKTVGFEVDEIKYGKLTGDYLDQSGDRTGRTYPINKYSPFKAMFKGCDRFNATDWLDSMLLHLKSSIDISPKEYNQHIAEVVKMIRDSTPLEPIVLTVEGDMLLEFPSQGNFKHTVDSDKLGSSAGVHKICIGYMDKKSTTPTHDVLICRSCHLRIPFPNTITTYGELRTFFGVKLSH